MAAHSAWHDERKLLVTELNGTVSEANVAAWKAGLAVAVAAIPPRTRFKLIMDLSGYEPATIGAHKAMREIIPRLLAAHGMRPAYIDLFDEKPEVAVTSDGRDVTAFANVHHDADKMASYERRIGRPGQRFFTSRDAAEAWIAGEP